MRPCNPRRNKPLQEQCRSDGAGMRLRRDIVEIGNRTVQPAVIAAPTTAAATADRVADWPLRNSVSAQPSSLQNIAGRSGPSATRAAPVSVAQSTSRDGDSSHASASRSHSTSRPSASVLPISTVMPFARADHVEWPHRGTGNGVFHAANPHDEANRQVRVHDHAGEARARSRRHPYPSSSAACRSTA